MESLPQKGLIGEAMKVLSACPKRNYFHGRNRKKDCAVSKHVVHQRHSYSSY